MSTPRPRINVEAPPIESPTSKKIKRSGYYSPIHELLKASQTPTSLENFFATYSPKGVSVKNYAGRIEEFNGFFNKKHISIQKKGQVSYCEERENGSKQQKFAEKFLLKFGEESLEFYTLDQKEVGYIAVKSEKDLEQINKFCQYCKEHDSKAFKKIGFKHVDIFEIDEVKEEKKIGLTL